MSGIDYYRILGVSPSATTRAIREAYLGLVRKLHPDRVGSEGTELFQQITEAYEILSDPVKRRTYDRSCGRPARPHRPRREGMGFGAEVEPLVSGVSELQVDLTPHEAAVGAVLPLVVSGASECPWCGGSGGWALPCLECGGGGVISGERVLRIRLPAAVRDGSVMEIPIGLPGRGELLIRLYIRVV